MTMTPADAEQEGPVPTAKHLAHGHWKPQEDPVSAATAIVVVARAVAKSYVTHGLTVRALDGVTFQVSRGEMVAIMGPSGCGKTTLLNCLAGLDSIDNGQILIDGLDIARLGDQRLSDVRVRTMGFIFQNFNLLPVLSAVENVEMPLLIQQARPRIARQRALELLAAVGIADRAAHRPAELSGGQRQRVAIARALVNDPAIVWADEPTGNLDSESAQEVMDLLVSLNHTRRQTLVLVTHAPDIAARANRLITMRDGRIASDSGARA